MNVPVPAALLRSRALAGLALLGGFVSLAAAVELTAPVRNWVMPVFSKEGARQLTARGTEARVLPNRQFEVIDLNLTFFNGEADPKVETVILSPKAIFQPDDNLAHGDQSVRFIRDEVEASGTRWTYDHAHKKISLDGDVHVTFHAEFQDLLK
jgi:lipopolysaccharide export system protein LptC